MATNTGKSEPSTELEGTKKKFKPGNIFSWHIYGCKGRVEQYYFDSVALTTLLTNDNTILFQPCSTVKLASVSYRHEPYRHGLFTRRQEGFCFRFIPTSVPFSFHTVLKRFSCRHRMNERPFRNDFVRFQIIPASCERGLSK